MDLYGWPFLSKSRQAVYAGFCAAYTCLHTLRMDFNPLILEAFCQKRSFETFCGFLDWIWTKLQTIECRRTTQRRTKQLGHSVAGSLVEIHVPDVTGPEED